MPRPTSEIVEAIDRFQPQEGNWLGLDSLLDELFRSHNPAAGTEAMLRVFQRFPTEDGAGVFWGIVHGLESIPGYEERLIESVRAKPSEFGVILLHRLLHSGAEEIQGVGLRSILQSIASQESVADEVRSSARKVL